MTILLVLIVIAVSICAIAENANAETGRRNTLMSDVIVYFPKAYLEMRSKIDAELKKNLIARFSLKMLGLIKRKSKSLLDEEELKNTQMVFFSSYRRTDIRSIRFENTLEGMPADGAWDVSAARDRSVMAWVENGENLHIAANGTIYAPKNAFSLFAAYENIESIDFNGCFDTSNVTDMSEMFAGCSSLTTLDVSGFDTANVTNMLSMFDGCSQLTTLDVSGFDTANVTDMNGMFSGCSSLTTLDVSGFDTANVTNMRSMFDGCSQLTTLDVSGFDTANVTEMQNMFEGCSSLSALDVSNFDTSSVTDMAGMFSGCSSLTALDVSNFDTANVMDMQLMFYDCSLLTALDVSGFDTRKVMDMAGMFSGCSSLTALDVSGFKTDKTDKVEKYDVIFYGCDQLGLTREDVGKPSGKK